MTEIQKYRRKTSYRILARSVKKNYIHVCYYCNKPLSTDNITIDHLIPLSRGGKHNLKNIKLCCFHCNMEKGNMTEDEYNAYRNNKKYDILDVKDIVVPYSFQKTKTRESKINKAIDYYNTYKQFDEPVTLISRKSKRLDDGYSRLQAAIKLNVEKIPVIYKY